MEWDGQTIVGDGDGESMESSGVMSIEDEEVSLVDGVLEGALGALGLEMEALVEARMLIMVMMMKKEVVLEYDHRTGFMGRK
ncbi:hypothetical protein Tco_0804262 [Tanacetum coccineum]|uniref:Uncharacterized protein n=1 Tax=Tanacetum coccineum TaxID=301880 RepID=A0ABQ5A3U7_9ASTR